MEKEIKIPRYRYMEYLTLAEICCHIQYRVPMPPEVMTIHVPDDYPDNSIIKTQLGES